MEYIESVLENYLCGSVKVSLNVEYIESEKSEFDNLKGFRKSFVCWKFEFSKWDQNQSVIVYSVQWKNHMP